MKEKRREKMKEKIIFFKKNVSRPSNPPDELAQNVSKKIPVGRIIPPFFFESSESDRVLNYLHDSNSIFRAQGIISEIFSGGTVMSIRIFLRRGAPNCWRNLFTSHA